ncbi:MAG: SRPBCC family protein [Woeseia sp.]
MTDTELIYETYIRASAERVWNALTSAEFTSQYFYGTHVESTWKPGAAVRYFNEPGGTVAVEGEVLEADPPNKLVISWHVLYDDDACTERPSRVSFYVEDLGEQTKLRIVHDDFPDDSVVPDSVRQGWPWIIAGLKSLLETGEALPSPAT